MKTLHKRILSVVAVAFTAIFTIFTSVVQPQATVLATGTKETKFEKTNVLDDLRSIKGFNILNYPFYESAEPEIGVVDFVEYCYDYRAGKRENYGLYIYIYNPNAQDIVVDSPKNKIRIAVDYDKFPIVPDSVAIDYEDFELRFCSMSTEAGTYRRFYKFKIIDHKSADGKTIAERVNSDERRYDLASILLLTKGNPNATAYSVSTSYSFCGYGDGYGNGKLLKRNKLETVELDLYSTTYRFPYINSNGAGHQNQLDSVYFAVPKEFNETYGELYRVKCCWNEQRTSPVLVTKNNEVASWARQWLGIKEISDSTYGFFANPQAIGSSAKSVADWGWGFGHKNNNDSIYVADVGGALVKDDTPAGYVFLTDKSNVKDKNITSQEMRDYIYAHEYAQFLFTEDVDDGRIRGYQEHTFTADEPFNMLTFNDSASGWEKFCLDWRAFWGGEKWSYGEGAETKVDPILLVSNNNFTGSDKLDADSMYIHSDDFNEFKKFYDDNKLKNNVFLLRFAVTDYYSDMLTVLSAPEWYEFWNWNSGHRDTTSTYMAQETVFLDFNIIQLTFFDDVTETVIPVVASPIDVIGGISAPISKNDIPWWWYVVAFVLLVLVVIVVYKLIKGGLSLIFKG